MILVDTSVWVDHFKGAQRAQSLEQLLEEDEVCLHPWVLGELALGSLGPRRDQVLTDLGMLRQASIVGQGDVLKLINSRELSGSGLGWVDVQLLASALVDGYSLWTLDNALTSQAKRLKIVR